MLRPRAGSCPIVDYGKPYYDDEMAARRGEGRAFFDRVMLMETDECIRWPFGHSSAGYGKLYIGTSRGNNQTESVHVLTCLHAHGPKPPGMQVAHSVGCPRDCFNKRHVRWDTVKGNLADRVADGTLRHGETHPRAKLTEKDVMVIRERYRRKAPQKELASRYGVSIWTIRDIVQGKSWGHL
jgi:hypothetical protein